jgi:cytochrome oxidase Cu insertion factor (SCO1/SenC/PrrC family)
LTQGRSPDHKGSWLPLWIIVVVFAMPVVAAWFFFLNPRYLPAQPNNRGELIRPVVPLSAGLSLRNPQGAAFDFHSVAGKWTLVFLAAGECGERCMRRLADLRQIRLALGEGRFTVQRLLVLTRAPDAGRAEQLAGDFEGMRVAVTDQAGRRRLASSLGGEAALGRVYILDPGGDLMMRYPADAPARDTLKDMERLLKASRN